MSLMIECVRGFCEASYLAFPLMLKYTVDLLFEYVVGRK